jgi:membrane protein
VISAVLAAVQGYVNDWLGGVALLWQAVDLVISFSLATTLIALIFKYLPDARIAWRDTWLGAAITAVLFIVGKQLIGAYLGQTTIASSYGAAGSVVVFMIWVYYAALILLFGAEITQAVADQRGAAIVPVEHAARAGGPARRRGR